MFLRRSGVPIGVMSLSVMAGLAVAGSSGASVVSPLVTVDEVTVATTAEPSAPGTTDVGEVDVLRSGESWGGLSLGEWEARSWQWVLSLPEDVSPWFDTTDERCGYGQSGPVFFLPAGPPHTCVVPEDTAIYVAVTANTCSTVERPPFFGRTEDELRACATEHADDVTDTHAYVDGQEVADLESYRIATPLFTVNFPENNVFGVEPGVAQVVAEGHSFIIAPPPPGEYEIVWSARSSSDIGPLPNNRVTVIVEAPQVATSSDTATSSPADGAAVSWEPEAIPWVEMIPGFEDGFLDVPIDYAHPDDGTFRLYMHRRLADDPDGRVGSLLVPSSYFVYNEAQYALDDEVLAHFDIIGFDLRGTGGLSAPAIDCVDDIDHYYSGTDITPDDEAERQQLIDLAREFADACVATNAEIIQFVGTNNAARDIDSIRRALGEDEISYYSSWNEGYGSQLGAVWATMFPNTVRAAVLDAAQEPNNDARRALLEAEGYENALDKYLAHCSADSRCVFHNDGDAENDFDDVMAELDESPVPSRQGRPDLTLGAALYALNIGLIDEDNWQYLSSGLSAVQHGSGSGMLRGYDIYFGSITDGTWSDFREMQQTIRCMDTAERLTVEEADARAAMLSEAAPRYHPPGMAGDYFCTFFPAPTEPRIQITGADAGPILVCGPSDHPATPLQGTRDMADALQNSYLIVIDDINAWCGGHSQCADVLITDYFLDLELPDNRETHCARE